MVGLPATWEPQLQLPAPVLAGSVLDSSHTPGMTQHVDFIPLPLQRQQKCLILSAYELYRWTLWSWAFRGLSLISSTWGAVIPSLQPNTTSGLVSPAFFNLTA